MKQIFLIFFLFIAYLFRLTLTPQDKDGAVSYRFIVLDDITHSKSVYTYQLGHTTIMWDQYPSIKLKDGVEIIGRLEHIKTLGITTRSVLKVEKTKILAPAKLNLGENLIAGLSSIRKSLTAKLSSSLKEPESSLAAGILLGVKRDLSADFKTSLIRSGTLHTVAASGYNVGLVSRYIISATSFLPHGISLLLAVIGICLFCLLSGSSPAVIRAGIMGTLILLGTGLGRQKDALRLLFVASYLILMFDPLYLFDVGFELSVAATFGILYLEPLLSTKLRLSDNFNFIDTVLKDYFYPTLAATIFTLPITYFTFGQFSLIGLIANPFVLPIIPLIMALTTVFLICTTLSPSLGFVIALFLYLPLTYFKLVVNFFGSI